MLEEIKNLYSELKECNDNMTRGWDGNSGDQFVNTSYMLEIAISDMYSHISDLKHKSKYILDVLEEKDLNLLRN